MNNSAIQEFALQIARWALGKKAEDCVLMNLQGLMDVTDFFVVVTAHSETQVQAIVDAITDGALEKRMRPLHVEGKGQRWTLIDFVDVVVHVMMPEERAKYSLERLWADARLLHVNEDGTVASEPGSSPPGGEIPRC